MTQESQPGIFKNWNWGTSKWVWVITFCVNMHICIFLGKVYSSNQILRGSLIT